MLRSQAPLNEAFRVLTESLSQGLVSVLGKGGSSWLLKGS